MRLAPALAQHLGIAVDDSADESDSLSSAESSTAIPRCWASAGTSRISCSSVMVVPAR